jgi:hypothetical protein
LPLYFIAESQRSGFSPRAFFGMMFGLVFVIVLLILINVGLVLVNGFFFHRNHDEAVKKGEGNYQTYSIR